MSGDIQHYCRTCDNCQRSKLPQGKRAVLLQPIVPDGVPASHWGADFIGPLPKAKGGVRYVLIAVDYTTRLVVVRAARTADGKTMKKFMEENVIQRYGWMRRLTTDQGTPFKSRLSKEFFKKYHIEHRMTTSYHQQADGLAEWANKTDAHGSAAYGQIEGTKGLARFAPTTCNGV